MQATLIGQLLFGPAIVVARFLGGELVRLRRAPIALLRDWLPHLAGVALLIAWLDQNGYRIPYDLTN